jgi:hypothetical protein
VALREDGVGRTELYLRVQYRDYKNADPFDQPGPTGFDLLNGFYNFFGIRQIIDLDGPERQLWLGYQNGFTVPTGAGSEQFQYFSNEIDVALRWLLPYAITGQIGYRFEHQAYAAASSVFRPVGENRRDNDHRGIVSFERPLSEISEHLFVNAAWFGTFNQSNKNAFEYDRQIGSIGAEVRF